MGPKQTFWQRAKDQIREILRDWLGISRIARQTELAMMGMDRDAGAYNEHLVVYHGYNNSAEVT